MTFFIVVPIKVYIYINETNNWFIKVIKVLISLLVFLFFTLVCNYDNNIVKKKKRNFAPPILDFSYNTDFLTTIIIILTKNLKKKKKIGDGCLKKLIEIQLCPLITILNIKLCNPLN